MNGRIGRRLICVGSVVVDIVMRVPRLPEPGGDVIASSCFLAVGGAFNVMSAARRQGVRVTYAGGHGSGPFGHMVRSALTEIGIEVVIPAAPASDTGICVTLVTVDGERTFATAPGAEALSSSEGLGAIPVSPDDFVYVSGYGLAYRDSSPTIVDWVSRLHRSVVVVFDPGPLILQIPDEALRTVSERCNWWTCNEREARLITGGVDADQGIWRLAQFAGRDGLLVRIGRDGCLLLMRDRDILHIPARPVEVVDTTGAGDAHTGAFLAALAKGVEPSEAVHRANVAASIVVSREGPATAPTSDELRKALAGEI